MVRISRVPLQPEAVGLNRDEGFATHQFVTVDGEDYACFACDAKPGQTASYWPCGAEIQYQLVSADGPR